MDIQENIVNKVAQSGLVTLDPASFYPQGERVIYDIKDNLFMELILREKDFRDFVKEHDWSRYTGKYVGITCTADAIVPAWAYMLLANRMAPYAKEVVFGDAAVLETVLFEKAMAKADLEQYRDQRVVLKGCGDVEVPTSAYVELTKRLTPVAKSLMFGEPCSTVPIYKRKDK
ncbi:DUF2480 family protein [Mucilaginibacter daejeonensis]|uniref:DUF2480 family protein n=1 Tax=Mucilaginibacter daejeonensis TaxID=398049 RepID=UPI001D17D15C|nr:DUF2480 family protein [Mucilaginibacter daejeonensis]UEG52952.1 DUF2480 family protein [Mucilaginibacter daejeonensis]